MKVLIDVSRMHTFSFNRGIGIYAQMLFQALSELSQKRKDFEVKFYQKGTVNYKEYDLIHYPFFDFYFNTLPFARRNKTLVTLHDVIPLRFKKYAPPGIRGQLRFYWQNFKLHQVKGIITDSKSSKRDIVKYLKIKKEKIFPVYLGKQQLPDVEGEFLETVRQRYSLPSNFILYVGDVNYHKNLPALIKAFRKLGKKHLVLVGSGFVNNSPENYQLKNLIQQYDLNGRIKILGYLSIKELSALYRLADFYIQPSLWEGFGLPVLEALSVGTPVIVSNNSSLREIVNPQVATFIEYPFNSRRISEAIKKAYRSRSKIVSQKLKEYANQFSWQKTAEETYKVYKKIVSKKA